MLSDQLRHFGRYRGEGKMPRKRFGAEQIIPKLREAEVDLAKALTVGQVCK